MGEPEDRVTLEVVLKPLQEEGGGVRSRPRAARTILLFHIISARTSKQPLMVGSTLGVYSFGLIFVSARTNKRHHHHQLFLCLYFYYCSATT